MLFDPKTAGCERIAMFDLLDVWMASARIPVLVLSVFFAGFFLRRIVLRRKLAFLRKEDDPVRWKDLLVVPLTVQIVIAFFNKQPTLTLITALLCIGVILFSMRPILNQPVHLPSKDEE